MLSKLGKKIKRLFTHPYGACKMEGCDRPRERWLDFCGYHFGERIKEAADEWAQMKFDREADVVAEGIRRAGLGGAGDESTQ